MENRFCTNKEISETKVVVAMSGGVDSSVVAAMLHDEGYQVIGVTLQLYDHGVAIEKKGACCAGKDIYDAKNVAAQIGFPHYVLNYESVFKEEVMEDFADSYLNGETPIPCVKCNQSVKFRDLFKVAKDLGADALATGHYVQKKIEGGKSCLYKAIDDTKDQSYFLFATTKEQLDYIYFPLGGIAKDDTRKLAQKYQLEISDKPDSQDICFVPNGSYAKVIERLRPESWEKGDIIDLEGNILGQHNGIINYTIGQRKGLGIGGGDPLYVVKIDAKNNQVIVGSEKDLDCYSFNIKDVNWLGENDLDKSDLDNSIDVYVKMRSNQMAVAAKISSIANGRVMVKLNDPQRAIAPGQACVFYNQERVLGGGWIEKF